MKSGVSWEAGFQPSWQRPRQPQSPLRRTPLSSPGVPALDSPMAIVSSFDSDPFCLSKYGSDAVLLEFFDGPGGLTTPDEEGALFDINAKDERDSSCLLWAARGGHPSTTKLLLDKGSDIEFVGLGGMRAVSSRNRRTPLLVLLATAAAAAAVAATAAVAAIAAVALADVAADADDAAAAVATP